jgi:uncharacterized membrane protein YphA (DoxX/SURF4 family)
MRQSGGLEDSARLLLRLTLGLLMLLHGIDKVTDGIDPILGMVAKAGLPSTIGHGVDVGEVLAPLLLIVGAWPRATAGVMAVIMVVAVALAHAGQLAALSPGGDPHRV